VSRNLSNRIELACLFKSSDRASNFCIGYFSARAHKIRNSVNDALEAVYSAVTLRMKSNSQKTN
jgi:hypothetical protein